MSSTKVIKLVVVGDKCAQKTELLFAFTTGSTPGEYIPTVFDNTKEIMNVDGEPISLGLWDTAGQEDYPRLRPLSYPDTNVFVLVFDVMHPASFERILSTYYPEVSHHRPGVPIVLVGNNIEKRDDQEAVDELRKKGLKPVSAELGRKMARSIGAARYRECSWVTLQGVKEVFYEAARIALAGGHFLKEDAPIVKLAVVGNSDSQVCEFVTVFARKKGHEGVSSTMNIFVDEKPITLDIWYNRNQLEETMLPRADIYLLVFDALDQTSFENISAVWCVQMQKSFPVANIVLVGTHFGKEFDQRYLSKMYTHGLFPVDLEQGEKLAKELGAKFYKECSVKSSESVVDVFEEAIKTII